MHRVANRLIYSWLSLAVFSLVFAGVFAFLAAMTRTPAVKLLPSADYFHTAIVGHVIFSLVVWFFAFMAVLWSYAASIMGTINPSRWRLGLWLAVGGMSLLTVSLLLGLGTPLLIDYIPLLDHPVYFAGLFFFAGGITMTIVSYARSIRVPKEHELYVLAHGMRFVAAVTLLAFMSTFLSAASLIALNYSTSFFGAGLGLSRILEILSSNYEVLLWGPGHIIQFANTMAMMVVWFILLKSVLQCDANVALFKRLMWLLLFAALALPVIYFLPPNEQARFFTLGMAYGLGAPSVFLTLIILKAIWGTAHRLSGFRGLPWENPAFSSLMLSIALFDVGGAIGAADLGNNLRVPAHYHGSLGAVTMAFMGMTYLLLPLLGIRVYSERTARLQPYLYGLGLLMIIIGLFWAGSYNAPRKAFDYEDPSTTLAMNFAGIGAVIAVLGGAAFVANAMLSLLFERNKVLSK